MVRKYVRDASARKYKSYTEDQVECALEAIRKKGLTLKEASAQFKISVGTLSHRMNNKHKSKPGHPTVLTQDEDEEIVNHVKTVSEWSFPFDTVDLRVCVRTMLNAQGRTVVMFKDNLPSCEWALGFLKRHSTELTRRRSQNIKSVRASVSARDVSEYFTNMKESLTNLYKKLYPDVVETSDNIVAGFRTCGIYPFDPHVILRRLPDGQPSIASTQEHVSNAVIEVLKNNRGVGDEPPAKNMHQKKLSVKPGKSIALEDISMSVAAAGVQNEPADDAIGEASASSSSASSEDVASETNEDDASDHTIQDNVEPMNQDEIEQSADEEGLFLSVGYYYVVKFVKKTKIQHYIGKIVAVNNDDTCEMKFLRRCKNTTENFASTFAWSTIEEKVPVFEIDGKDVVKSLDQPNEGKRGVLDFGDNQLKKYSETLL